MEGTKNLKGRQRKDVDAEGKEIIPTSFAGTPTPLLDTLSSVLQLSLVDAMSRLS